MSTAVMLFILAAICLVAGFFARVFFFFAIIALLVALFS